jgi:hypothetical protein
MIDKREESSMIQTHHDTPVLDDLLPAMDRLVNTALSKSLTSTDDVHMLPGCVSAPDLNSGSASLQYPSSRQFIALKIVEHFLLNSMKKFVQQIWTNSSCPRFL